ncbi:MAG: hypothetical protein KDC57_03070 [Saprospiraceae bacterium]|nr:hypothetical protein [Saprospiraceae bacterium]
MDRLALIAILLTFLACNQSSPGSQTSDQPQVLTHWLSGDWNTESGEAVIQAHWQHPRRNYWECVANRQDFQGNSLPDQHIWIKRRPDDMYWITLSPAGDSIYLKANTIDTRQMVFENKDNKDPDPEQIKLELEDSVTFRLVEYIRSGQGAVRINTMKFNKQ